MQHTDEVKAETKYCDEDFTFCYLSWTCKPLELA